MVSSVVQSFDVIVVGAGSAGLLAARMLALAKKKVCLIEKSQPGGRKLFFEDVPLHEFQSIAHTLFSARRLGKKGAVFFNAPLSLEKINDAIRARQVKRLEGLDEKDLAQNGISLRIGTARFRDKNTIETQTHIFQAPFIILATGSLSGVPVLDGLESVAYRTIASFWDLNDLPESAMVFGSDPAGICLAESLSKLGCPTTLLTFAPSLAPELGPYGEERLLELLQASGVRVLTSFVPEKIALSGNKLKTISGQINGSTRAVTADELIIALGRVPAIDSLNLTAAGIPFSEQGIKTNPNSRTNQSHIFAIGSCTGYRPFQDATPFQAQAAVGAILQSGMWAKSTWNGALVPRILATRPPIAALGWPYGEKNPQTASVSFFEWQPDRHSRAFFVIEKNKKNARGLTLCGHGVLHALPFWKKTIEDRVSLESVLVEHFPSAPLPTPYNVRPAISPTKPTESLRQTMPLAAPSGERIIQPPEKPVVDSNHVVLGTRVVPSTNTQPLPVAPIPTPPQPLASEPPIASASPVLPTKPYVAKSLSEPPPSAESLMGKLRGVLGVTENAVKLPAIPNEPPTDTEASNETSSPQTRETEKNSPSMPPLSPNDDPYNPDVPRLHLIENLEQLSKKKPQK